MTGIMNVVHGVEHFFGGLWIKVAPTVKTAAAAVGQDVIKVGSGAAAAAITAAVAAKAKGGDINAMERAGIEAGEAHLSSVGVVVGLEDLTKLGSIAAHVADGTAKGTAPPPADDSAEKKTLNTSEATG